MIGIDGEQIGIISLNKALDIAWSKGMDLVEIVSKANPSVCRIMNYKKYIFEKQKRKSFLKKNQKKIQIKEVKLRPATDIGDYKVKLRSLIKFLESGDKTKITVRFRGREMAHQNLGIDMMKRLESDLKSYGVVENHPKIEGRQIVMLLTPRVKNHRRN